VQSDVATWAHDGTGVFAGRPPLPSLRFAANLYPESLHLVVRKDAGLRRVADLRGRRVSLDEPGSGTLLNARAVLAGHGLAEADLRPEYVKPDIAGERLRGGRLDAFFIVAGWPTRAVEDILASGSAALLAIDGPEAAAIHARNPFLVPGAIPGRRLCRHTGHADARGRRATHRRRDPAAGRGPRDARRAVEPARRFPAARRPPARQPYPARARRPGPPEFRSTPAPSAGIAKPRLLR
jgi:hypothetical protein